MSYMYLNGVVLPLARAEIIFLVDSCCEILELKASTF